MIPYQICEVYLSVFIYLITKIVCAIVEKHQVMHKHSTLTSISENKEQDDEVIKWVPKKKHEVLKAKYKCLKKLFQIYDASVIGILPDSYTEPYPPEPKKRRKRSRRTKTDACAGTTEVSNGDVTIQSEDNAVPTAIRELQQTASVSLVKKDEFTQDCKENASVQSEREADANSTRYYKEIRPIRRPTRFQCFLQRIFGLKPERPFNARTYASDNDIICYDKRRRRGLRFRRVKRPRNIRSEMVLKDVKSPIILSYVQSVQKNFLMESTPRQCPISGCRMMFYGIINYNDHLNLCHFPERQYICHYCHEGFTTEYDKVLHENEHLGISKLSANVEVSSTGRQSRKIASVTQTEPETSVPEEKLKKIVSFFDKITNADEIINEIKKNQYSESNLQTTQPTVTSDSEGSKTETLNLQKKSGRFTLSDESDVASRCASLPPIRCQLCGEQFDNRRQLSLHIDIEHRTNEKFSKFHSCAGIVNTNPRKVYQPSEFSEYSKSDTLSSKSKDCKSLSGDPSTNIVYYTSLESLSKRSVVNSLVQKVRSGFCYKWEPGIINYNDHLNLCHFPERQYICHYCHEGFTTEYDKVLHENEHLGISKLSANVEVSSTGRQSRKIASVTQTEPETSVPEEKLKKIVSFFDKITNADEIINEIKKNQYSESNLQTTQPTVTSDSEGSKTETLNLQKKSGRFTLSDESDVASRCASLPPIRCQLCGEQFDNRRQLSLHIDIEHRTNEKFSKFHSCAGIVNTNPRKVYQPSEFSEYSKSDTLSSKSKDCKSLSGDPSTNIVYYTSLESLSKRSVVNSLVQKVRSGFCYKWEPGTKIIRV